MDKIRIKGQEIEFDANKLKQISDEELESINGGFQPMSDLRFYSWICNTCHEEGATFLARDSAFSESMIAHKAATGHCEFTGLSAICSGSGGYGVNGVWTETV